LEKDHYVFYDLRAADYVVSYPTDFGAPETSDRITLRFGTHSLVDPQITSRVSAGTAGAFHYTYLVANGTQARQPIRKLILAVPADDQSAQFQTGTWKTTHAAGQVPGFASPVAHLVQIEWSSEVEQAIPPGLRGSEFSVDSFYLGLRR
jgi:hypothetical protein